MQKLFPPLPQEVQNKLLHLPKALQAALPMQSKHQRQLPFAVEELSMRLTSERGLGHQPYWSAPRFTAAYVWYFLPWNILRLTRLFLGLNLPAPTPLPLKEGGEAKPRIFADMGSGPLSLPIALWLAKPAWRDIPLTVLCTDASPHPLQIGQKIFTEIAGKDSPWRIVTSRAQLESTGQEMQKLQGIPWLITAANVCNELKPRAGQSLDERLSNVLERLSPHMQTKDASLLFIEPGTRLGGKTIVSLRDAAESCMLYAVSPCPHNAPCPLEDSRTWCHFTFDTAGSPDWLNELSASAKLRKDALSLAFVHISHKEPTYAHNARIISAPFQVPNIPGFSRYACCAQGLALLGNAAHTPSGALVPLKDTSENDKTRTDAKSGAFILEHTVPAPKFTQNKVHTPLARAKFDTTKPLHKEKSYKTEYGKAENSKTEDKKRASTKKKLKASKKETKKFWEK